MDRVNAPPTSGIRVVDIQGHNGAAIAPTVINSYSTLSIPAYWRAINFLANNLASFPRSVHREGAARVAGTPKHPLERLLDRRPNNYQTSTPFWRTWFYHACHAGNGYARIERRGVTPVALHNLLPEDVWPFRYDRGQGAGLEQWYYHAPTRSVYPGADILHLQGLGHDGMFGIDPVMLHEQTFQGAMTIGRYQIKFLQKGTVIRGAVQIPSGVSEAKVQQIISTIRSFFSGPDAERDTIVLSDGAEFKNATLTPHESQLIEQAKYTTKQIAQITGVPPEFLFELAEAKYNASVEQAGQNVVRYTLRAWIIQANEELSGKLLSEAEQDLEYKVQLDPGSLLLGDSKAISAEVVEETGAGLITANEGRKKLKLPPDPDPESDKLKMRGDTAPKPKTPPPAAA